MAEDGNEEAAKKYAEQKELYELGEDIYACLMVIPFLPQAFIAKPSDEPEHKGTWRENWKYKLFLLEYYGLILALAAVQGTITIYVRVIWEKAVAENTRCGNPDNHKTLRQVCIMCYIGYVMADLLETYTMILWLWTIAGHPCKGVTLCGSSETETENATVSDEIPTTYTIIDAEESSTNKITVKISNNLREMSLAARFFLYFVVIGFKIAVAFALIGYGSGYVIASEGNADLILNALALCFILDVDGMVYEMFVSQEYKAIMQDHAPRVEQTIQNDGYFSDFNRMSTIPIKCLLLIGGTYIENEIYCPSAEDEATR